MTLDEAVQEMQRRLWNAEAVYENAPIPVAGVHYVAMLEYRNRIMRRLRIRRLALERLIAARRMHGPQTPEQWRAEITRLADVALEKLDDEHADRQYVLENLAYSLKALAA